MSQQTARTTRLVVIAFALLLLTFAGGYYAGKDLARRDNAVAAAS
jgi:hypothetical protein